MKKEDLKVGMIIEKPLFANRTIVLIGEYLYIYSYNGQEYSGELAHLGDWQPKKPEPKIEILYECLDDFGIAGFYFRDGSYPVFKPKEKAFSSSDNLKRKTGRTLKINMDTFEIIGESDE